MTHPRRVSAYATYLFSYDGTGHLTGIRSDIGTAEGFGPIAYASQTLCDPFGGGCGYGSHIRSRPSRSPD